MTLRMCPLKIKINFCDSQGDYGSDQILWQKDHIPILHTERRKDDGLMECASFAGVGVIRPLGALIR